jgi:hypothetical protein
MRSIDAAEYAREIVALRELGPRPWVTWGCPWEALARLPAQSVDASIATPPLLPQELWGPDDKWLETLWLQLRRITRGDIGIWCRASDVSELMMAGAPYHAACDPGIADTEYLVASYSPAIGLPSIYAGQIVLDLWPPHSALGRHAHRHGASYLAVTPFESTANAIGMGLAL